MTANLAVSEIFGPTVQGEGMSAGRRAAFLRLGGCNLSCSWCDTPYTWDKSRYDLRREITAMPVDDVLLKLLAMRVSMYVITGGEPLLQSEMLIELLKKLYEADPSSLVEIETNGTQPPLELTVGYNVSPKLGSANQIVRYDRAVIDAYVNRLAQWKFVVDGAEDAAELREFVDEYGLNPQSVWVMPQATSEAELDEALTWLPAFALRNQYNYTDRMHIRIWGGKRGR